MIKFICSLYSLILLNISIALFTPFVTAFDVIVAPEIALTSFSLELVFETPIFSFDDCSFVSLKEFVMEYGRDGAVDIIDGDTVVVENCEIFLPLEELVDIDKEIERLKKEKERLEGELKRVKGKLSNEGFIKKAPKEIVDKEKEKQEKYQQMMDKVIERLNNLTNK